MTTQLPSLSELGGCTFAKPQKPYGYALGTYKGKQMKAHRAIWLSLFGDIPKGMVIDHVCHSVAAKEAMCLGGNNCIHRSCVNPAHLEIVTHAENMARSARKLSNRKYCSNGHPVKKETTRQRVTMAYGKEYEHSYCVMCERESQKRSAAKSKALKNGEVI